MSYGFSPEYEQLVIAMSCTQPSFWSLTGRHMLPAGMDQPEAQLLLRILSEYGKANGDEVPSALSLREQLIQQLSEGVIKQSACMAAQRWLEQGMALLEDTGILASEASAVAAKSVISEHQRIALEKSVDAFAKGEDLTVLSDRLAAIKQIGVSAQTTTVDFENALADIGSRRKVRRMNTGIDDLDLLLGGVQAGTETVFVGAPGGGKCLAKDTPVLMHDGSVRLVQDIVTGHLLAGPDKYPRRVSGVTAGIDTLYLIVPKKGMPWSCNSEHILVLHESVRGVQTEVAMQDFLQWPLARRKFAKLIRSATTFSAGTELVLVPYLMGMLLGGPDDASVCAVLDSLFKYDLAPANSRFIPQQYKRATLQERYQIIAGLIDSVGQHDGRGAYDLVTKFERLADDVAFIARSVGLAAYVTAEAGYRVHISGRTEDIPCRVESKQAPAREQRKDPLHVSFDVHKHYGEYFGFQVDRDGLFLLGDFTLTHNSMCLSQVASNAMLLGLNVLVATLEVSRYTWNARLIASMLNIPITPIEDGNPQTTQRVQHELYDLMPILGHCAISYFTPQATSVREIITWVRANEQRWRQRVDVLVVDYADKLIPEGKIDKGNSYEGMREVYEKLRIWAEQNGAWVYTAAQAKGRGQNNKGRRTDVDDVADSMHKSRVCDLMITLDMVETNGAREVSLFVAKNRLGESRFSVGPLPVAFEVGRLVY